MKIYDEFSTLHIDCLDALVKAYSLPLSREKKSFARVKASECFSLKFLQLCKFEKIVRLSEKIITRFSTLRTAKEKSSLKNGENFLSRTITQSFDESLSKAVEVEGNFRLLGRL